MRLGNREAEVKPTTSFPFPPHQRGRVCHHALRLGNRETEVKPTTAFPFPPHQRGRVCHHALRLGNRETEVKPTTAFPFPPHQRGRVCHHALRTAGFGNSIPPALQTRPRPGFLIPSPKPSQNRRFLRRFYACPRALYGAFTPVLHTLFSVNDTFGIDTDLHRSPTLTTSTESL